MVVDKDGEFHKQEKIFLHRIFFLFNCFRFSFGDDKNNGKLIKFDNCPDK